MFVKRSLVAALAVQTCTAAVSKSRDDNASCTKTTVAILLVEKTHSDKGFIADLLPVEVAWLVLRRQ